MGALRSKGGVYIFYTLYSSYTLTYVVHITCCTFSATVVFRALSATRRHSEF